MSGSDAAPGQGPIFIVGAMGSGTTLLRLMLDSHEHIAIPRETGFMRAYKAHQFTPFKHSGRGWTRHLGWKDDEFRELMRGFYDQLFMRYATEHGKQRWGEKTPLHTWHIDDIVDLFPDARIVAVVRHPLGSAASNISRFGTPITKASRHWWRYTREIARQCSRHGQRMVALRYEDLVTRPEPVMRELLEWLEEPWSDAVLEHHVVQGERGGPKRVEGRTRRDQEIDVSRIDKWTRTLTAEQRAWLEVRGVRMSRLYGYSNTDAAVLEPLGAPDRMLIHGADLARRIHADPELELDVDEEPWLSPYERLYDPKDLVIVERTTWNEAVEPRGVRAVLVRSVKRLPEGPRKKVLRTSGRVRRALGRQRRPGKKRLYR